MFAGFYKIGQSQAFRGFVPSCQAACASHRRRFAPRPAVRGNRSRTDRVAASRPVHPACRGHPATLPAHRAAASWHPCPAHRKSPAGSHPTALPGRIRPPGAPGFARRPRRPSRRRPHGSGGRVGFVTGSAPVHRRRPRRRHRGALDGAQWARRACVRTDGARRRRQIPVERGNAE